MTKTFTPLSKENSDINTDSLFLEKPESLTIITPGMDTINNILMFSRNLDVRPSQLTNHIIYLKS